MRIIHDIDGPAVPTLGAEPYLKPHGQEKSTDWMASVSIHVRNPFNAETEDIFFEGPARYMIPMIEQLLELLHVTHEDYVNEGRVEDYRKQRIHIEEREVGEESEDEGG